MYHFYQFFLNTFEIKIQDTREGKIREKQSELFYTDGIIDDINDFGCTLLKVFQTE